MNSLQRRKRAPVHFRISYCSTWVWQDIKSHQSCFMIQHQDTDLHCKKESVVFSADRACSECMIQRHVFMIRPATWMVPPACSQFCGRMASQWRFYCMCHQFSITMLILFLLPLMRIWAIVIPWFVQLRPNMIMPWAYTYPHRNADYGNEGTQPVAVLHSDSSASVLFETIPSPQIKITLDTREKNFSRIVLFFHSQWAMGKLPSGTFSHQDYTSFFFFVFFIFSPSTSLHLRAIQDEVWSC